MPGAKLGQHRSNAVAIAVSALPFGLLHLHNIYWLDAASLARSMAFTGLVFGPVAGYVRLSSRSLWPAVILHYSNNLSYYV